MPTWKKVIVSGSNISQLNNDAGYLTSATVPSTVNSFATMSVNGINVLADSGADTLTFASSSGAGLSIVGDSGADSITFTLTSIPNVSLANSSVTVGSTNISLGATATTLAGLSSVTSTTFVGALTGTATTASNITPAITNLADNRVLTSNTNGTINGEANLTFDGTTLDVRGSGGITTNQTTFPLVNTTATTVNFAGAATALTMGDATSATTTIRGGTLVGNLATQNVFNTTATTVNAFGAATTLSIGAGTGTTTVNNNLVVAGDLTISGTTTIINTNNLLVEDKFILLSSGSTSNTEGGIVVQNNSNGSGFAYFLDDVTAPRWGYTSSLAHNSTGTIVADEYAVSAKSVAGTWTAASAAPTYGGSGAGYGNMVIDNSGAGDIWIYA